VDKTDLPTAPKQTVCRSFQDIISSALPDVCFCQQHIDFNGIICPLGPIVHTPFWKWHWTKATFLIRQLNLIASLQRIRF
jgi:hypothetical protein